MTNILAIETSTQNCSVSLQGEAGDILVEELAPQQHAQLILPMVDQVLSHAGIGAESIDYLVYGQGPGAFTGLRIAAGVVQGLALGWDKPVIGLSSLKALAYEGFLQTGITQWSALMDARMQEIYVENVSFDPQGQILKDSIPSLCALSDLESKDWYKSAIGDVFDCWPQAVAYFAKVSKAYPSAKPLAKLAFQYIEQAQDIREMMPQPIYLRSSVTN